MSEHMHDCAPAELANGHQAGRSDWALYGATGVTGRLVLAHALKRGHRPLLIGRDRKKLESLAAPHGLAVVQASLDDTATLASALNGRRMLLNVAGPFATTGAPLIRAALAARVHYVDLNGELPALQYLLAVDAAAQRAGVALVGGAGFGIAASDGLAMMVSSALGGAEWLRLSVAADSALSSPAVAESTLAILGGGGREIVGGRLVRKTLARQRWSQQLSDGSGQHFASAPLADLVAAHHATGAARITAGVPMPQAQARAVSLIAPVLPLLLKIPAVRRQILSTSGHSGTSATCDRVSRVWVQGGRGTRTALACLEGGEGYAMAADLAVQAAEAIGAGNAPVGAHTPATAFGPEFIRRASGVRTTFALDP